MTILNFIDRAIVRIAGWILVLVLSVMIVLAFGQIILRNIFGTSIEWGDILLRHLVLWVGFLGATIATGEDRHIKIDFLIKFIPKRFHKILAVATSLFAAYICYLLLRASLVFIEIGLDPSAVLILDLPIWYFVVIIPFGYGLMAFRFIVLSLRWTVEAVHGDWHLKGRV